MGVALTYFWCVSSDLFLQNTVKYSTLCKTIVKYIIWPNKSSSFKIENTKYVIDRLVLPSSNKYCISCILLLWFVGGWWVRIFTYLHLLAHHARRRVEFGIPGCYADCSNFIGSALYIVHIEIKQYLTL